MNKQLIAKLALIALAAGAGAAHADVATSSFKVTMVITKTCALSTVNDINLGTFTATAATITPSANSTVISVNCSKNTPFTIGLLPSAANTGTANGTGNMKGVTYGDLIPYSLYSNAGLSTVWGNTTGTGGNVVSGTTTGMATAKTFTAYAKVTTADYSPDTYEDIVAVTVTY